MDLEQLSIIIAELRGEVHSVRELFALHTTQDMEQFTALNTVIGKTDDKLEKIDEKLDQLLIREAGREGEMRGIKKSTAFLAGSISSAVTLVALVVNAFV